MCCGSMTAQNAFDAHDTACALAGGDRWLSIQATLPPVGLVEVTRSPDAMTHNDAVGHVICPKPPATVATSQALAPPVGLVLVTTCPDPVAAQNVVVGQEIDCRCPGWNDAAVQPPAPPVGLVEEKTLPSSDVATHRDAEAHETAVSGYGPGATLRVTVHAPAPPVGSDDVSTSSSATIAQKFTDGHDGRDEPPSGVNVHADAPPVGSVLVMMPLAVVPMHNVVVGHVMAPTGPTSRVTVHALVPPRGLVEVRMLP